MPVSRLWQRSATSFRGGFLHVSAYALDFYILLCYYFNDRVTGTDMNKNSCKAAESAIDRTILRMAVAAGSLEKGQKGYGRNEF